MTLLFDGQNAFFAERGKTLAKSLIIHLPEGCSLFFNGTCFFPQNTEVHLPTHAIRKGENRLALRKDNRIFSTESLLFDGNSFTPAGFCAEALILSQNELISDCAMRIAQLAQRIEQLEQRHAARMLFS